MSGRLLTLAIAGFALSLQPAAACELTGQSDEQVHLATTSVIFGPPVVASEAGLPSIGSLTMDSDFTKFMEPGVPMAVRTMALRKLWSLNPVFSRSDGLDSDLGETGR